jgi:AcrR family transcriptional regulator
MARRKYELKRRAEQQAETRTRIVEAIVDLHRTVGPAYTTVSAIAERAGVERLTVYRHFPAEADQVAACSAHWRAQNPRPDVAAWREIADPAGRLPLALAELYAFFDRVELMLTNILRDAHQVPALQPRAIGLREYLSGARDDLAAGWPDDPLVGIALGHVVQFETWRSLVRVQGLSNAEAVALMARFATCLIAGIDDADRRSDTTRY